MIPDFRNCSTSPLPRLDDDDDRVDHVGDVGLGLAHADGLDHDDVIRRGQRLGGGAVAEASPPSCSPAEVERMNTPASEGSKSMRARSPSERAARPARARIDGEHRHRPAVIAPDVQQGRQQRRLAGSRRSRHADDVAWRLTLERGGGDLAQQRRRLLAVGRSRALEQVERVRCGAQLACAQARADRGSDPRAPSPKGWVGRGAPLTPRWRPCRSAIARRPLRRARRCRSRSR